MNRRGLIHRDLKPENILLNSKEKNVLDIRIADFGFSTFVENPFTSASVKSSIKPLNFRATSEEKKGVDKIICGTAGYIAPEVFFGKGYSIKSDIFSLGSIVYSLFTFRNLFQGPTNALLVKANKHCTFDTSYEQKLKDSGCSKTGISFIQQLLLNDPSFRPTAF